MILKQETKLQKILTGAHNDYEKGLNIHAFFKMHDREISEDLVQDTFIKTWKYLVKGGKIDIMKAFLYHILNDLIIDEYRRSDEQKKHKTTSLDLLATKGFEPENGDSGRLFNFLDGKAAFLLIKRLPKKYQKVINMRYLQDLSLKEMSLAAKKSKNNIAVLAHRGLKKLKLLYRFA